MPSPERLLWDSHQGLSVFRWPPKEGVLLSFGWRKHPDRPGFIAHCRNVGTRSQGLHESEFILYMNEVETEQEAEEGVLKFVIGWCLRRNLVVPRTVMEGYNYCLLNYPEADRTLKL